MDSGFLVALEAVLRLGGLILVVLRAVLWVALGWVVVCHQDHWGHWGCQKEVNNGYLSYSQILLPSGNWFSPIVVAQPDSAI